ncbi:MAG: hypothetical protein RIE56_09690 [Amphiplicatus sp.]
MLNLKEYRDKPRLLSDYLPWAASPAPGIVLNKDGSFQKTFRYRGPDLESATDAELVAATARVNNVLRRFGSGWALYCEAVRVEAHDYPHSEFGDAASWLVDEERRLRFEGGLDGDSGDQFESHYYLTLLWLARRTRRAALNAPSLPGLKDRGMTTGAGGLRLSLRPACAPMISYRRRWSISSL